MTRRLLFLSGVSLGGLFMVAAFAFLLHLSAVPSFTPAGMVQKGPPAGAEPTARPEPPGTPAGDSGPGRRGPPADMPAGEPNDDPAPWLDEQTAAGPRASDPQGMTPLDVVISKVVADFGKHHALSPAPIRRADEPNAVGAALAPVRRNFASIHNLSAKVTVQVAGQDYLTGRIVMRDKPTPRMLLDLVASTGRRTVALYDGRFLFAGEGRAGAPLGVSLVKEAQAPAYQGLTETSGTSGAGGGLMATSPKYSLTLDPATGRVRAVRKYADDTSPRSDVSILRYAEFPGGLYFPAQMQSEDVVGEDTVRSTTVFTDIILNTEELDQPAFADPPSIYMKVGGS
jgi:hypothetical protein